MTEQPDIVENKVGKPMVHNREERALDTEKTRTQTQRHGHRGILMMDLESKMETVTTFKAAYIPPKSPGVRLQGIRGELFEKHLTQMISEKIAAERRPLTPKTDYSSTTQRDFCVEGFVSVTPETTQAHDYKTDQAITFWSENCQHIQGVSAIQTLKAPFFMKSMSHLITENVLSMIPLQDFITS
uniref:sperm associated antigen 8 n=1 Tax=Scatophagus argus TaxID=75038 RepID=UPI001ED801BB|nr:sperm associated antigen 8 [Scatophagus argus]